MLSRSKKRSANTKNFKTIAAKEGAFSRDKIEVGDLFSTDKFVCKNPGRLPTGYGRESCAFRYQGGNIYKNATSSLIWVENKVSLGINETVISKSRFEKWLWDQVAAEVSHYHGNN